jgi:hypothetical protein
MTRRLVIATVRPELRLMLPWEGPAPPLKLVVFVDVTGPNTISSPVSNSVTLSPFI